MSNITYDIDSVHDLRFFKNELKNYSNDITNLKKDLEHINTNLRKKNDAYLNSTFIGKKYSIKRKIEETERKIKKTEREIKKEEEKIKKEEEKIKIEEEKIKIEADELIKEANENINEEEIKIRKKAEEKKEPRYINVNITQLTSRSRFLTMIKTIYKSLLIILLYEPLNNKIIFKSIKILNDMHTFFNDKSDDNLIGYTNLKSAIFHLFNFFKNNNLCNDPEVDNNIDKRKLIKYLSDNNFMLSKQLYTILKASFFNKTVKIQYKNDDSVEVINENFYKAVFRYNKVRHTFENEYLIIHDINNENFITSLKLSYDVLATVNIKRKENFNTLKEFFKQENKQEIIAGFLNKHRNNTFIRYIYNTISTTDDQLVFKPENLKHRIKKWIKKTLSTVFPYITNYQIDDATRAFNEFIIDNLYIAAPDDKTMVLQYSNIATMWQKYINSPFVLNIKN